MKIFNSKFILAATLLMLFLIGIWQVFQGETGFGSSLIGATVGVGVIRYIKGRKIHEMQARGLNPYDERIVYIADKASRLALSISIVLAAVFVLFGSAFGPVIKVNPYNFLGFCLAILTLIYLLSYYHYSRNN